MAVFKNIDEFYSTFDPGFAKFLKENYPGQMDFPSEEMQKIWRTWQNKGIDPLGYEILPNGMLYKEGRMGQYAAPPPTTSPWGSFTPDIRNRTHSGGAMSSGPQAYQQLARQRMFKATGQPQNMLGGYQPQTGLYPAIAPMRRPNTNLLPYKPPR